MKPQHFVAALLVLIAQAWAEAGELVGEDKIFIRFTNLRTDDSNILVRLNITPNHPEPFSWWGWVTHIGQMEDPDRAKHGDKWLSPGQRSPWVDIGRSMTLRGTRSPDTYLSPVLCGVETTKGQPGLHLLAEVAEGQGNRVVRRIEVHKAELAPGQDSRYPWVLGCGTWNSGQPKLPTLALLIPTRMDIGARIYTFEEALNWQLDFVRDFPDIGRRPTQFVFKTSVRPELFDALGYRHYPEGTMEASFGDEISIHLKMAPEEQNRRFREHLKSKGLKPLELISDDHREQAKSKSEDEQWDLVTISPSLPSRPKQYYESADFRYRLWYEELKARTEQARRRHPIRRVLTGANFSPHMNVWPDVRQWVGPFRVGAMTMSWTEDWWWQIPETTPQVYGFLLDAFRLAYSYHGSPIQFYIMPYRGNSPDNFRRMNIMAAAHGTKIFNHFVTDGQMLVTWDYVSILDSPRTYQAIHDVIRDLGAVEHQLHPAMPQPAEIAIMLSRASDAWDTEDLGGSGHLYSAKYNVNNEERKALWTALRHAQYPVDLILDEDIAGGRLGAYKVLYIVGSEMLRSAAEPLRRWVEEGGVVWATGGGGLLDEYREPIDVLHEVYGVKDHELVRHERHIRPRHTFKSILAHDTLVIDAWQEQTEPTRLPAYLYRETLVPVEEATVRGRYESDRAVGLIENAYGRGRAIYCGSLAGIAYWQPAVLKMLPTDFPTHVRQLITTAPRRAGLSEPVRTSHPLVEAQYMTGPTGNLVVLINWSDDPIDDLVVRFAEAQKVTRVRSLRAAEPFKGHLHEQDRGDLALQRENGTTQVRLPLAIYDFLLVN